MKILALVPLRGGSKSIIKKNIKFIADKPLCEWTLSAAVDSQLIEEVYVSTDSQEIKKVVQSLDMEVRVIDRPAELATDSSSTESVIMHFMDQIDFDCLVTIQATSPLLQSNDLDQALEYFIDKEFDSLLSVVRTKSFFWDERGFPINYNPLERPRRQEFKGTLMENGAFYITDKKILEQTECRLGGNIGFYEMSSETATEIDEASDWEIVSNLLKKRHNLS